METITVEINNKRNALQFAAFAKNLKYVKSVYHNQMTKPLTDEEWITPGRVATDKELDIRI